MDRSEKKRLREKIGEHLDVSGTRMTDDEATLLGDFLDNYDQYRGQSFTETHSHDGWCSDGKFTRTETDGYTFTENPGIRHDYEYHDDDSQSSATSTLISDARGVLNFLKELR